MCFTSGAGCSDEWVCYLCYILHSKVYLTVNPYNQQSPDFMHNFGVTTLCVWEHVTVRKLPSACLPKRFRLLGSAMKVVSVGPVLPAAIKSGTFFTVAQLRLICQSINLRAPAAGSGSGKTKNVIKIDWATSLVKHLFETDSPEEQLRMIQAIMGTTVQKIDPTILELVSQMTLEEAEAYKHVKKSAMEMVEAQLTAKVKRRVQAEMDKDKDKDKDQPVQPETEEEAKAAEIQKLKADFKEAEKEAERKKFERINELTPAELKLLLPGRGSVHGVFFAKLNPVTQTFRVEYRCHLVPVKLTWFP